MSFWGPSRSLPLCKNDAKGQVCNAWQWQVAAVSTAINSFGFIAIFLWNDFWCNVAVQGMLEKVPFLQFLGVILCYKIFHFNVEDRNSKLFLQKLQIPSCFLVLINFLGKNLQEATINSFHEILPQVTKMAVIFIDGIFSIFLMSCKMSLENYLELQ